MVNRALTDPDVKWRLANSAKGHAEASSIKTRMMQEGFSSQISLYGIIRFMNGRAEYRRIEILVSGEITEQAIADIYNWFLDIKPLEYYTLWAYDTKMRAMCQKGGWQ
jgi:hypothetical protein